MNELAWLDAVKFNEDGLIPVIAQDNDDGQVLMVAWMNRESLQLTVAKNQAVYWSRSRQKLWHKGETSGHFQEVHGIFLDCDADVICLSVIQKGGIACHTGRRSCFYKQLVDGQWQTIAPVLKDPNAIYGDVQNVKKQEVHHCTVKHDNEKVATQQDTLSALAAILEQRKRADSDSSYVASLYQKGLNKILEKVGEEAVEAILAAKDMQVARAQGNENILLAGQKRTAKQELIYEVADLWFHTMVMLSHFNITPSQVLDELARRFGVSGHAEKSSRKQ